MPNALIVDTKHRCAAFLESVLGELGVSSSVSRSWGDAHLKVETGLFDMIYLDIVSPVSLSLAYARYVEAVVPGLPLIGLTDDEEIWTEDIGFQGILRQPLGMEEVIASAEEALDRVRMGDRRADPRLGVSLTAALLMSGKMVRAHAVDLSLGGVRLEIEEDAAAAAARQAMSSGPVVLHIPRGSAFPIPARIAHIDGRAGRTRVGLAFCALAGQTRAHVSTLTG